ncbi:hypothetical protein ACFVZC_37125 [Streptomyces marokkonensis]|uniref:Uncharacterized protein n=1 Tax=Streptomyces marokkonensis TaxID=324855 RepID=A0ABW6QI67_9ACTN
MPQLPHEQVVSGPCTLFTALPGGPLPHLRGAFLTAVGAVPGDVDLRQRHVVAPVAQTCPGHLERQPLDGPLSGGRGGGQPLVELDETQPG